MCLRHVNVFDPSSVIAYDIRVLKACQHLHLPQDLKRKHTRFTDSLVTGHGTNFPQSKAIKIHPNKESKLC